MITGSDFSDEQLTAFLDGEADDQLASRISEALEHDAIVAARLEALEIDKAKLKATFDQLLDQAPALQPNVQDRPESKSWKRSSAIAASIVVASVLAFSAGRYTSTTDEKLSDWTEYVAAYHALYTNSTLSAVNDPALKSEMDLKRVSEAIGKHIDFATVSTLPGLEYKRSQILGIGDHSIAQLTYLTNAGEPVAFCIINRGGGSSTSPALLRMESMAAAKWTAGGHEFLLIGGKDDALIQTVANTLRETI